MSILTGTITSGPYAGQTVEITLSTARIPELPELGLPFQLADLIAVYDNSENKTSFKNLQDFREFILTGSGLSGTPPVVSGADFEIVITSGLAGTNTVSVPALAGFNYTLERRPVGRLLADEWEQLPGGGFILNDRDANGLPVPVGTGTQDNVLEGEIFIAHVYDLVAGPAPTAGNTFLDGIAILTSDTTLVDVHKNKVLHIAGGSNAVEVELWDLVDADENQIIVIETTISNTKQTRVKTKSGQLIYFGNSSQTELYLGISEFLWLMRGDDGWYVLKASDGILNIGQPLFDYVERLNTKMAIGQTVNRSDYPRLWNWLTANSSLIVTDADWVNTQELISITGDPDEYIYKYRGKFSYGNGTTTFRFPDLQEMAHVGLKNIGGSDADRDPNTAGTIQKDANRKHRHDWDDNGANSYTGNPTASTRGSGANNPQTYTKQTAYSGSITGTKVKNVGLLPLIRI